MKEINILAFLFLELVLSFKSYTVKLLIGLESNSKVIRVGLYVFRLVCTTVARHFTVGCLEVGKLHIVTGCLL